MGSNMGKKNTYNGTRIIPFQELDMGANYTEDEIEFMLAMERYKREKKRKFPNCHEVLIVLKSLGYVKKDKVDNKSS